MNDADGVLLSVSAEARQLVAPDYAVLDGLIEHTARSKAEALRSVAASLDRLTADLAARGAVPFDEGAGRRPLTWSAHSSATREERYHDKETGRVERSGQVTATVALRASTPAAPNPPPRRPGRADLRNTAKDAAIPRSRLGASVAAWPLPRPGLRPARPTPATP